MEQDNSIERPPIPADIFRRIRQKAAISQQEVADIVGKSQKIISMWETGRLRVPWEAMARLKERLSETNRLSEADFEDIVASPSELEDSSEELFSKIWDDASRRARRVAVSGVVRPARAPEHASERADLSVLMEFEGVTIPSDSMVYMDHMGIANSRWEITRSSKGKVVKAEMEAIPANAIAYEIKHVDETDKVFVDLLGSGVIELAKKDSVGFPVYPDFPIERIKINLTFEDVEPTFIRSQALLLRRSLFRPEALNSNIGSVRRLPSKKLEYEFGPVLRPKVGYFYCLTWNSLKRLNAAS